jgi:N-acetylglucosaminyldiphosphoundecaprenol N-acetyl-beta-D-mannosaminyltransferase
MAQAFGLEFSNIERTSLVDEIADLPIPPGSGPRVVQTANVDHIVQINRNEEFRESYRQAWAVTADGMPVFLYAKLRGLALPERVTGADLFQNLMPRLVPGVHRCFFLASSPQTAERLSSYLLERGFAPEAVAAEVPPFGFETNEFYSAALARRIAQHQPTHLFMGVGAPKSEVWIHRHRRRIGDCYVLSVGAGLDFFTGQRQRAPAWVQRCGFEWFWRFAQEPRRLFRRYFVDSLEFFAAIAKDLRAIRPGAER